MGNPVLVIQGPTASGKTKLAIEIAQVVGGEIISADSRQFYREMSIGTAKPSPDEMQGITHHFINSLSIHDPYSAGDFERDALVIIQKLLDGGILPIVVGGSGLYIQALLEGFDDLPHDQNLRAELNTLFAEKGIQALQQMLVMLDPEHYAVVDLHNPMRLIRAIELVSLTGRSMSSLRQKKVEARPFNTKQVALDIPRDELYARINERVDTMVESGLPDEARRLYPHRKLQALQTVGYTELFAHIDGEISLDKAVELIKRNSRRYAKRQLTWMRKMDNIKWLKAEEALESCLFLLQPEA